MSGWSHVPGAPGGNVHGAISGPLDGAAGKADLSGMLDANGNIDVNLLNGLDMDMSLPMDLDMDLSQQAHMYNPTQPQQTGIDVSQAQEQGMIQRQDDDVYPSQDHQQEEANMSGVAGAGPLPTSFGMQTPANSSTLTEFTKRRNWSQRIIEELKDLLHILTPDGHEPNAIVGKFIAEFVHPDDSGIFMREFNESIASGNGLRFFYRFKKDDGTFTIFECDGHPHISPEPSSANQNENQPPVAGVCRGFFMMARPYPTRNAALLDSFLEHKIENERLMKRISELKKEEADENDEQERLFREHMSPRTSDTPGRQVSQGVASRGPGSKTPGESALGTPADYQGMPPPAKPTISNTALTRQNLDSVLSAQKPDSIADKMSRYEANSTHLESIELLTGLRYRDGERSHGISTGDTSPALIRGDAGIAILLDRDRDGPKKDKKKQKLADEYVCADCGTLDSPEWRKGPKGPKTLCNACGLRWAKKEKKRGGDDGKTSSPMHGGSSGGLAPGATMGMQQPPGMPMQASTGSSG
ncbi:white collar 2 type of transcription factor [Saxophila tyrrhenica]|uniref:White collar 2 type of transcription factor n=1 Tax=Saxophila tyrrhenica TaxID=1690608 RepID=A0AAV9PEU9_9PEZI|nr:white collar 2 type of transcription factor [Saxophila tyrrhenica]